MRLCLFMMVALLAGVCPAHADGAPMRAGKWEVGLRMGVSNLPMPLPERKHVEFLDEKQAVPHIPLRIDSNKAHCANADVLRTGAALSWTVVCTDGSEGSGKIVYAGESFAGTITMRVKRASGKALEMTETLRGRWLGACAIEDPAVPPRESGARLPSRVDVHVARDVEKWEDCVRLADEWLARLPEDGEIASDRSFCLAGLRDRPQFASRHSTCDVPSSIRSLETFPPDSPYRPQAAVEIEFLKSLADLPVTEEGVDPCMRRVHTQLPARKPSAINSYYVDKIDRLCRDIGRNSYALMARAACYLQMDCVTRFALRRLGGQQKLEAEKVCYWGKH